MVWKRGAVIMEAKPFVHVVKPEFRERRCNFCLSSASEGKEIRKCTACKKLWYCGKDCQRADWKIHKIECRVMRRTVVFLDHTVHLSLRLLIRYLNGEVSIKHPEDENPCIRTFNDLMSHSDKIKTDPIRFMIFRMMFDLLHTYTDGILQLPDDTTLLDIFGKVVINSFSIMDGTSHVGAGIYVSPSILDHRCWGNAVTSFEGRKLVLRALDNIPSESLSDVFISYVDPMATIQERQEKLQKQYYFTCNCLRCQNTEVVGNGEHLQTNLKPCCMLCCLSFYPFTGDAMMLSVEGSNQGDLARVKDCVEKVLKMKNDKAKPKDILDKCQKCLSAVQLPHSNIIMVGLTQLAFDAAVKANEWKVALKLGKEVSSACSKYRHPCDGHIGYTHSLLGHVLMCMGRFSEARLHLRKAEENFSIVHGKQHILYNNLMEGIRQCEAAM